MTKFLIKLIKVYQKTISPDHGIFRARWPHGFCRFYPSCSQYAIESLNAYGWKGVWPAIKRIGRCNPFSLPKVDKI